MRICLVVCAIFISSTLLAQFTLTGKVIDAETNQPLGGVSIFISNTSIGTITKQDGSFNLGIPQGRYEVVCSYIGYATKTFSTAEISNPLEVKLSPSENKLDDVILIPFEKNGWQKWGNLFIELFIGVSDEAQHCRIENTDAIRFRYDKQKGKLTAVAFEPLTISNKSLGYIIKYQLENFTYDFEEKYLFYQGYPLFTDMNGSKKKIEHWHKKREEVYEGSMMHFMRSLYSNTIVQDSFNVFRLQKIKNTEKERIREVVKERGIPKDSSNYYDNILSQPNEKDFIYSGKLTGDSIAFAVNKVTAGLDFDNYLYIVYTKKKAPAAYYRTNMKAGSTMASQITILNKPGYIEIESPGNFFPAENLLSSGYWGWSEKIARMLPFDYRYGK